MSISDRITGTVENWRKLWGKILHDFASDIIRWGIELLLNVIGQAAAPKLKPLIDSLEATGKVPPELQPILDELKSPTGQVAAMFANSVGMGLVGGAIGRLGDALFGDMANQMNRLHPTVPPALAQTIALRLRDVIDDTMLQYLLETIGIPKETQDWYSKLAEVRLDPATVIILWRRFQDKWGKYLEDLKHQGWNDERIEALKDATLYYPSPAELVHWTAREVFEPDKVSKYGLMADADKLRREDFYKAGMDDEQIDNHWIAHWEHASFMQIIEMLHRGIITEQDVKDWFPLVEVAPYWAENLIKIAYTWPTRVDVRRWWDMRTITEERLRELYEGMGYRDQNLEDYMLWTKVYTDFPMMIARFTKGWITQEEVKSWLIAQGVPEERAEHFMQEKVANEAPGRVQTERDLTKAEIIKGVKNEVISPSEGIDLLIDMGYDRDEAEFMLEINIEALRGSPDTYLHFKKITQLYKQSQRQTAKIPPLELIQAERDVNEAERALKEAREKSIKGTELQEIERVAEEAKIAFHQLLQQYTK